jgi:hypothetical protein
VELAHILVLDGNFPQKGTMAIYIYCTINDFFIFLFFAPASNKYLCMGFRQNSLAEYTSGYIVGTYIVSD